MKILALLFGLAVALALSGCARFHSAMVRTEQTATNTVSTESRQTITTFWDSQSSVGKLRASTTDKTQGLTVGGLDQESSGTNAVEVLNSLERLIRSAK